MITEHRTEFFWASDTSREIEPEDCVTVVADEGGSYTWFLDGWRVLGFDDCYYEDEQNVLVRRFYLDRPYAVTGTVLYEDALAEMEGEDD